MPTTTFSNLPEAKRRALIDLALDEFAGHPYGTASLSRIVARAGIAKGSVYQYFADKQELYLFLLDYAIQEQLRILASFPPPDPHADMFAALRWQMHASLQVDAADPRLTRLMYHAVSDELPFREEVARRIQAAGEEHVLRMVRAAVARGEIDPAIDAELAAFFIRSVLGELRTMVTRRLGRTLEELSRDPGAAGGPEVEYLFDVIIRLLRHGLAAAPSGVTTGV